MTDRPRIAPVGPDEQSDAQQALLAPLQQGPVPAAVNLFTTLTQEQIQGISQTSCSVLRNMGPEIQWLESFVTDDKIYCIYIAPDEATVRQHAEKGGFPANSIAQVRRMIDPTSAEGGTAG